MWPLGLVGVLGLRLQCHTTRPQAVTCHQDDSDDESEAAAKRRRKRVQFTLICLSDMLGTGPTVDQT